MDLSGRISVGHNCLIRKDSTILAFLFISLESLGDDQNITICYMFMSSFKQVF